MHWFAVYDIKVCCTAKIVRYRTFFTIQILQLLLLQCETLQICKCRYIHTYHFESLAMKKVKTLVKLPFTCTPNQCTRFYTTKETHQAIFTIHTKNTPLFYYASISISYSTICHVSLKRKNWWKILCLKFPKKMIEHFLQYKYFHGCSDNTVLGLFVNLMGKLLQT